MKFDARYWQSRYEAGNTPWDIGYPSPALIRYFEQLPDKSIRILIPGAGFGHEAAWLLENGFEQTYICEWASQAVAGFLVAYRSFPKDQILQGDFFRLEESFDLLVEQTFLSAIHPDQWYRYAQQCKTLLGQRGTLAGLLFAQPFDEPGPPFGGTPEQYMALFSPHFKRISLTPCVHSITPRQGRELFLEATNS